MVIYSTIPDLRLFSILLNNFIGILIITWCKTMMYNKQKKAFSERHLIKRFFKCLCSICSCGLVHCGSTPKLIMRNVYIKPILILLQIKLLQSGQYFQYGAGYVIANTFLSKHIFFLSVVTLRNKEMIETNEFKRTINISKVLNFSTPNINI